MNSKRLIVFGATGRVGLCALQQALDAGHEVTAFVRTPAKLTLTHPRLRVAQGDTLQAESVVAALHAGFDAALMTVGVDPLRPSAVVQNSVRTIVAGMQQTGVRRYIGITGTAQMPATAFGRFGQRMVRRFIKAAADHQVAYEVVIASDLDYCLAACPYIRDGAARGRYQVVPEAFPGGFKTINPPDVANFLVKEAGEARFHRQTVGIWY
ncbi:NAD(P)-dependent oxidoreductase [Deinococcus sp.]|uniref:NAD(P)-dependent oxidoreductase n=1 Tax=Deinococcus sp. TaxID=47478 RepID=UPI003CC6CBD0